MIEKNYLPQKLAGIKNIVYLPFDFIFHFNMELPTTLKKKDVYEYVLHRLPKIYPGNVSEIEIDIRPSMKLAEVFIISRESLYKLRERYIDHTLTSIVSIMPPISDSFIRIVLFDGWYEKAEYCDGKWNKYFSNSYDNPDIFDEYFNQEKKIFQVICNEHQIITIKRVSNRLSSVISFRELNKRVIYSRQLFPKKKREHGKILIALLLVLCLLFVNVISVLSSNRSVYLINEYRKELSKAKHTVKELEQINVKIDKINTSKNSNGMNAIIIARILEILAQYDPSLKLTQVSIESLSFSIAGKVSDSIKFAEYLTNNSMLSDIVLSGVKVLKNGEEQFGLTGKIND